MRLSDLIGLDVIDEVGRDLGKVKDVRFWEDAPVVPSTGQPTWRLDGLVVGGTGFAQRLGYVHGEVRGPWLLGAVMRRLGRAGHYVPWERVADIGESAIIVHGTADELDHPYRHRENGT